MHNWNRHTRLAEYPHWSLDMWKQGYHGGKGQIESTTNSSPLENSELKAVLDSRRDCSGLHHCQGLKCVGVVIPASPHSYYLFDLCPRQMDLRKWQRITVNLTRWWFQLQLLYQMWCHCLSTWTSHLVPGMQLLIWQMDYFIHICQ